MPLYKNIHSILCELGAMSKNKAHKKLKIFTCPWIGDTDTGDTVRVKADFFCHDVLTVRFEKDTFW